MKGLLVATLLGATLFASAPSAAQTVRVGVKVGLSASDIPALTRNFEDEGAVDLRMRYGWLVGGFATVRMATWAAFQPEVLYAQRGIHGRDPAFRSDTFEVQADYIDVPLLLRLQSSSGTGVYALAGPSLNFNVAAKTVDEGSDEGFDIKDDTESFEFGLVFGAGLQLGVFLVEGRYAEGLTNIAKDPDPDEDSYRNRSFAVLVGFRFP